MTSLVLHDQTELLSTSSRTRKENTMQSPFSRRAPKAISLAALLLLFAAAPANLLAADDDHTVHGQAPPDMNVLSHTRGGAFFVPKDLMEQHDQLFARVGRL